MEEGLGVLLLPMDELIDPPARTCYLPFYRRPGPLPPNVLAGRATTWRRRERWVHGKGRAHGRGPRQGAASLKLKSHRPTWAVVGAAEVRGAAHGDVRLGALLQVVSLSRKWRGREPPLLGAALLTAL